MLILALITFDPSSRVQIIKSGSKDQNGWTENSENNDKYLTEFFICTFVCLETWINSPKFVFPGSGRYKVCTRSVVIALTAKLDACTTSCTTKLSLSSKLLHKTLKRLIQVSSNCCRDVQPSSVVLEKKISFIFLLTV